MVVLSSGLDGRRRGFQVEFLPRVVKETFLPIFPTIRQILAKRYSSAKFALIPGKYQWLDNIYGCWMENYFSLEYEKIFWSKFEPTHIVNWKFTSFFSNEVKSFYSHNRTKLLGKFCQYFWIKIFHFKHHHSLVTSFLIIWSKNHRVARTIFW